MKIKIIIQATVPPLRRGLDINIIIIIIIIIIISRIISRGG